MARHKDASWLLNDPVLRWDEVITAVLMDIRDELKQINRQLSCANTQAIPGMLRRIAAHTSRIRPRERRKR